MSDDQLDAGNHAALVDLFVEMFECAPGDLQPSSTLSEDLAIDSLDAADLRAELQYRFDVRITDQRFLSVRTFGDVLDVLTEVKSAP